jgi:hypothetical protein
MNTLRRGLSAAALLLPALAGCSAQPVDGEWTGEWTVSPTVGSLDVTLVQKGTSLTGKVSAGDSMCWSDGQVKGTITGDDVLFGVVMSNGAQLDFKGTASVNSMKGTFQDVTGCTLSSGSWTLAPK